MLIELAAADDADDEEGVVDIVDQPTIANIQKSLFFSYPLSMSLFGGNL